MQTAEETQPRKRKKAAIEGDLKDVHAPETLEEAKRLRSAGADVSTDNLSVDDKRKFIDWLESGRTNPEVAPKRGNEKLEWLMRPTTLTGISGRSATDGQIESILAIKLEFDEEDATKLPLCISKPALALLKESRRTDSGKNSARVMVRRDWRTMTYRFQSSTHDELKVIADIKGEPEFVVVQDKDEERLVLKLKLSCHLGGNAFAQLAQMLKSEVLETEAFEEQLSLLEH